MLGKADSSAWLASAGAESEALDGLSIRRQGHVLILKGRSSLKFVETVFAVSLSTMVEDCINPHEARFLRLPAVGSLLQGLPRCAEP